MTKITSLQAIAAALLACGLSAAPAQAGPNRTFVSGLGTDSGACTRALPCKTFAFAITVTSAGGEIDVLDPAGYGAVTITKAISIVNDGVGVAAIGVSSGNAITINTSGLDTVSLRGLTINGVGTGTNGISFTGSGTLDVLDCTVRDMTNDGISVTPSFGGTVVIADTTVSNNNKDGIFAVASPLSGSLTITLSHVKAINNGFTSGGFGVRLTGVGAITMVATIDSTLIAENGTGLDVDGRSSNIVTAFVSNSNVVNNANSITVGASTSIKLEKTSDATTFSGGITNNGTIISFGDNAILDNVTGNAIQTKSLQ